MILVHVVFANDSTVATLVSLNLGHLSCYCLFPWSCRLFSHIFQKTGCRMDVVHITEVFKRKMGLTGYKDDCYQDFC